MLFIYSIAATTREISKEFLFQIVPTFVYKILKVVSWASDP